MTSQSSYSLQDVVEHGILELNKNTVSSSNCERRPIQLQVVSSENSLERCTVVNLHFGPESQITICPYCNKKVSTSTVIKATTRTHIAAFKLFFICMCCCPYYFKYKFMIKHYCPSCDAFLGYFNEF